MFTVIGLSNAYQEEPDFWTYIDFNCGRGRILKDSRGLRFRQGRAVKMIENGETSLKKEWHFDSDCRLNGHCGLFARRFNRSSESHARLKGFIHSTTRCLESKESDEDIYYCDRGFV